MQKAKIQRVLETLCDLSNSIGPDVKPQYRTDERFIRTVKRLNNLCHQ